MNQPPDPYQQYPQPGVYNPNNVPSIGAAPQPGDGTPYGQPGGNPYAPDYNQPGYYPPPAYPPQSPTSYAPPPYPPTYPPPPPEPGQWSAPPPQTGQKRRAKTGWIIGGGVSAIVIIAIVTVALITTHGFTTSPFTTSITATPTPTVPPEPPSSWLGTYHSSLSGSKFLEFIQWTNQGGQLNGSWQEYDGQNSQSYTITGTYNDQSHTVTLNVSDSTQSFTVNGTINGNTMLLHIPDAYSSTHYNDTTFQSASQQDFNNAKQNFIGSSS